MTQSTTAIPNNIDVSNDLKKYHGNIRKKLFNIEYYWADVKLFLNEDYVKKINLINNSIFVDHYNKSLTLWILELACIIDTHDTRYSNITIYGFRKIVKNYLTDRRFDNNKVKEFKKLFNFDAKTTDLIRKYRNNYIAHNGTDEINGLTIGKLEILMKSLIEIYKFVSISVFDTHSVFNTDCAAAIPNSNMIRLSDHMIELLYYKDMYEKDTNYPGNHYAKLKEYELKLIEQYENNV